MTTVWKHSQNLIHKKIVSGHRWVLPITAVNDRRWIGQIAAVFKVKMTRKSNDKQSTAVFVGGSDHKNIYQKWLLLQRMRRRRSTGNESWTAGDAWPTFCMPSCLAILPLFSCNTLLSGIKIYVKYFRYRCVRMNPNHKLPDHFFWIEKKLPIWNEFKSRKVNLITFNFCSPNMLDHFTNKWKNVKTDMLGYLILKQN